MIGDYLEFGWNDIVNLPRFDCEFLTLGSCAHE